MKALIVIALLAIAPGAAQAASFDCAAAKTPRERLICGDAKLSALDAKLGGLYKERRALLSPAGVELLTRAQRDWLRYADIICPASKGAACLSGLYDDRLKALAMAGRQIGAYRFNRVDLYAAKPAGKDDDGSGWASGFYVAHVAYPQIDDPRTPAALAWNKKVARKIGDGDCGNSGDYDTDYEIGIATGRVLSVAWTDSLFCHGTPHGQSATTAQNLLLEPMLRPVTAAEIFGPGTHWTGPLKAMFWKALLASGWSPPDATVKPDMEAVAIAPDRWFFTKAGLEFDFSSYEGGCYACTPSPVTLSWAALRPLLLPKSPVP